MKGRTALIIATIAEAGGLAFFLNEMRMFLKAKKELAEKTKGKSVINVSDIPAYFTK